MREGKGMRNGKSMRASKGELGEGEDCLCDIDPDDPENMSRLLAKEETQADPQSFCLNDVAPEKISSVPTPRS